MSQRVTLDDTDMRARLRSHSHVVNRPSQYVQRPITISRTTKNLETLTSLTIQSQATASIGTHLMRPKSPAQTFTATLQPKSSNHKQLQTSKGLISDFAPTKKKHQVRPVTSATNIPIAQVDKSVVGSGFQANQTSTDRLPKLQPVIQKKETVARPVTRSLPSRQEHSKVLMRQVMQRQQEETATEEAPRLSLRQKLLHKPTKSSLLMAMAVTLFVVGIGVSFMGFRNDTVAHAQETKINKQIDAASTTSPDAGKPPAGAPSTTKISGATLASYTVAPDLARYIKIPKIGVNARVLQVGVTKDGALDTPANVFDTAWYKASSKPGQPGATLIDGHVSSWTSNGVFYNIKKLVAGDTITIQKGDGTILTYSVVKTIVYDANNVDMQSLMQTAQPGKSGLNLITCGGKYDSKSGEFTQRVAVYAVMQ